MSTLDVAAGAIRRDETLEIRRALATRTVPNLAIGIPVVALLIVLLCCETTPRELVE